ncbi:hypothetical protein GC105_11260 [Alkalibaculum sp. M08DMB]|uniref:Peptidase M50 domain-containing protein n=1 Tax=Alkalibaculum sporogenes TaxID=2655001 RepID=A0A6A7KAE9_9FIRM|nr:hypothetical protein [Alkalibaculum sporogenes]
MILYIFLLIYLVNIIIIIIHELAHYIVAKILWNEVEEIVIGSRILSIKLYKVSLSPIIFGGRVDVKWNKVANSNIYQIILFFLSGVFANFITLIICWLYIKSIYGNLYIILSGFTIVINSIPIYNTDMSILLKVIKKLKKYK